MKLQRQIGGALMLGCFLAGPSLAEIINVNVHGIVSGSEDVSCFVFDCTSGQSDFGNATSQLGYGMYALSGSGSATALPSGLTAAGSAQETADTTSGSFSVDLKTDANAQGSSGSILSDSDVTYLLTLSFHLTQPSILDLNGSLNDVCSFFGSFPCANDFDFSPFSAESIDLSGSGFDFNQQANFVAANNPVNFSATLSPGEYTLTASSGTFIRTDTLLDASLEISLNADFISAVPEPTATIGVPILLLAGLRCASLIRRRRVRLTPCNLR